MPLRGMAAARGANLVVDLPDGLVYYGDAIWKRITTEEAIKYYRNVPVEDSMGWWEPILDNSPAEQGAITQMVPGAVMRQAKSNYILLIKTGRDEMAKRRKQGTVKDIRCDI